MISLTAEETLMLLTCRPRLGEGDAERLAALLDQPLDWAYILWRAETFQTIPILLAHLRDLGLESRLPESVAIYMANWGAISAARSVEQYRELGNILQAFNEEGLDHFVMKGAAIAGLAYPDPKTRPMQDIDLMIHPRDAWRVQKLVYRLGYRHGVFVPRTGQFHHLFRRISPESLRTKHALHSVTKVVPIVPPVDPALVPDAWRMRQLKSAFNPDGSLSMPVYVDFHVNLSVGMDLTDVWRGAGAREMLGRRVNLQSITAMVWFSAARLYLEAFGHNTLKLQMLGDIDGLLRTYVSEVDWAELLVMAERYSLGPPLFYVLGLAREILGTPAPEAVLALLMPDQKAPPAENDYGDLLPKLLSRPFLNRVALASAA